MATGIIPNTTNGVSFFKQTVQRSATLTVTLSQNATGVIFFGGANANRRGIASYCTNAQGGALCTSLVTAQEIAIATSGSSFTITNNGSASAFVLFIHYNGNPPTFE